MPRTASLLLAPLAAAVFAAGCASTVPYDQITSWPSVPGGSAFPAYTFRNHGTWGAGELSNGRGGLVFDGIAYHRLRNGQALPATVTDPLASGWAVRFRADRIEALPAGFDEIALFARVAEAVPDKSMPCAFRVTGVFASLSVEAADGGEVHLPRAAGSLYGRRAPDGTTQCWFLSSDRRNGGKVAAFRVADASLAIDLCPSFLTIHLGAAEASRQLRR
jgi:hypothetical protein